MKINVIVKETQTIEYVYEITNIDSLENAQECAIKAINQQCQPNAQMTKKILYPSNFTVDSCEVVEFN